MKGGSGAVRLSAFDRALLAGEEGEVPKLAMRILARMAEVRGAGLMLGLRCQVPNAELMARLRDGGLLTVPAADNVLRILPPLIIEAQQVEEALGILEQACADWPKAA